MVLRFERPESLAQKLTKLEGFFVQSGLPLAETPASFLLLLSIPLDAKYEFPDMPPDQQKQQTMRALNTSLLPQGSASSRSCSSWKICTGSIRPRWSS